MRHLSSFVRVAFANTLSLVKPGFSAVVSTPPQILHKFAIMPKKAGETWFYAVRKGRCPGVYNTWPECQEQVKGFRGPMFKKFPTYEEALAFANGPTGWGSKSAPKEDAASAGSKRSIHTSAASDAPPADKKTKVDDDQDSFTGSSFSESEGTNVHTDGGCFFNGMNGAKAGIGVYWGEGDEHNVSERLPGRPTNNRAEILAAVKAIEIAKQRGIKNLVLHTDSQFMINGITKWVKGWKKKGWVLSTGKPVVNKEDFEKLDAEIQGINIKWKYVKGHSGDPGNEAVDKLAKQGAKKDL